MSDSFLESSALPEPALAARRGWLQLAPPLLVLLSTACGLAACFFYVFNHDVSYLLHAAGRLLRGETLYVDVMEINPPLIVWLNLPIAWLAQLTGVGGEQVFRLCVLALGLLSLAWSAQLLRGALSPGHWWSWLAAGSYVALLLPGYEFGQREHIVFLCILPYLAEAARRCGGQAQSRTVQAGVAALATLGLALKPHFLLVPMLVEAFAFRRERRLAVGCLVALALLLAYLAAAWLFAPHYLEMLRVLAIGYWGYTEGWMVFLDVPYFYVTCILVFLALLVRGFDSPLKTVLGLAALGFVLAALVQHKGFSYHWIAAVSLAWMLFGQAAAAAMSHRHAAVIPAIMLAVSLLALAGAVRHGGTVNPYPAQFGPVIRELGGGPVIIFSTCQMNFPLVTEPGIGTSTRIPTMSFVLAMQRSGQQNAIRWVHATFAEDFYRKPPRLLLLETDEQGRPIFDFINYFSADVPELLEYRVVHRLPRFQVLSRR
ncbi:hypothetical protein [Pseudoduganella sp. OTU4001]|uniref:hypothetical protein n=1 Tax=Pseudoduganella sp. OTU4001 TaxID=3043854 RepID=UPI00313DE120